MGEQPLLQHHNSDRCYKYNVYLYPYHLHTYSLWRKSNDKHLPLSRLKISLMIPLPSQQPPPQAHYQRNAPARLYRSTCPPSHPAPPSNTLLITRLENPKIFHPASLATIRQHINELATLNSFSPLKSLCRIICSFYDTDSAIRVRQAIDGTPILGTSVAKCYFGEPTPIGDEKKYLERPDAGR